jgi:pimeloyl-ACP methyl ester carboxylesterase
MPRLVDAGYHVLAPDMRGYNTSDKPDGIAAYRRSKLVGDIGELIEHVGVSEATVVGHDWGGAVAWCFAQEYPDKLADLAVLNGPHPIDMARGLKKPRQMLKSWYIFFFQIPWLPEVAIGLGDCAMLRRVLRNDPVDPDAFTDRDIQRYVDAFRSRRTRRAAINYYRAAARYGIDKPRRVIDQPVLVIRGEQDPYLGPDVAKPPVEWVPNCRFEPIPDASHWVQMDRPDRVADLLLDHLPSP